MKRTASSSSSQMRGFALIVGGVSELNEEVEGALFEAGCDDATLSVQYGRLYIEFSRTAPSLKDAILTAIRDVMKAGIGARVLRVDDCNLVSAADIARRLNRSRQLVHQYMVGQRGPGRFPAPECHLADRSPIWSWCEVSRWLVMSKLLPEEASRNAEVVEVINTILEAQTREHPELMDEVARELRAAGVRREKTSPRARRSA